MSDKKEGNRSAPEFSTGEVGGYNISSKPIGKKNEGPNPFPDANKQIYKGETQKLIDGHPELEQNPEMEGKPELKHQPEAKKFDK